MIQKTVFMFAMASLELLAAGVLLMQSSTDVITNVVSAQPMDNHGDDEAKPSKPKPIVVFEDRTRIACCIIGAMCGAFVSVALFPGKDGTAASSLRGIAMKFGASATGGIILTPKACYYANWDANADNLVTASFLLGTIVVSILHTALPLLERKAVDKIKSNIDAI